MPDDRPKSSTTYIEPGSKQGEPDLSTPVIDLYSYRPAPTDSQEINKTIFDVSEYIPVGMKVQFVERGGALFIPHRINEFAVKIVKRRVDLVCFQCCLRFTLGFNRPAAKLSHNFMARWTSLLPQNVKRGLQSSFNQEEARLRLYVLPYFGHRKLDEIMANEWEKFLNSLVTHNKLDPATRNRVRSMLSKMYNDALRQNKVSKNPILRILKLKESKKKWDYWGTLEETEKYLEAAKDDSASVYLCASLLLNSGARIGEILALDWCDVDLKNRSIRIRKILEDATDKVQERTKGFNERWLGINDSLFAAFEYLKNNSKFVKSDSPLIHKPDGTRSNHSVIRRIHRRLCVRAKIREIRIHDLRHTFASHYIMNGGSLAELQGLLGHTSPMMTLKYTHLHNDFLKSRANIVSFSVSKK